MTDSYLPPTLEEMARGDADNTQVASDTDVTHTPLNADDELRKTIEVERLYEFLTPKAKALGVPLPFVEWLVHAGIPDLLEPDRKKHELQARLDELRQMSDLPYIGLRVKRRERLNDRADELRTGVREAMTTDNQQ